MLNGRRRGCPGGHPPFLDEPEPSVIICHCQAVSDRVVRSAILCGAVDVDDVADRCGAGSDCGGCRLRIERLLAVERPVALRVAS
jgi:bacterioferritin-associated ferredoxin